MRKGGFMTLKIDATYERGVFVPSGPMPLAEHQRVRLTVESSAPADESVAATALEARKKKRIILDPEFAREIATSAEFDLLQG
jgi:predicted DNA-binding antitoxin AbrB/MazE fold protein